MWLGYYRDVGGVDNVLFFLNMHTILFGHLQEKKYYLMVVRHSFHSLSHYLSIYINIYIYLSSVHLREPENDDESRWYFISILTYVSMVLFIAKNRLQKREHVIHFGTFWIHGCWFYMVLCIRWWDGWGWWIFRRNRFNHLFTYREHHRRCLERDIELFKKVKNEVTRLGTASILRQWKSIQAFLELPQKRH